MHVTNRLHACWAKHAYLHHVVQTDRQACCDWNLTKYHACNMSVKNSVQRTGKYIMWEIIVWLSNLAYHISLNRGLLQLKAGLISMKARSRIHARSPITSSSHKINSHEVQQKMSKRKCYDVASKLRTVDYAEKRSKEAAHVCCHLLLLALFLSNHRCPSIACICDGI